MSIMSYNLELYGFMYSNKNIYWGGHSYKRVLDRQYPDEETSVTTCSTGASDRTFIFIDTIKQSYFIDGTVTGHFKATNDSSTTYDIGECGVKLAKIDRVGNITSLGGYMNDFAGYLYPNNENYETLDFKFDIVEQEIKPYEKLLVVVRLTSGYNCHTADLVILHDIFTNYGYDLYIKIPLTLTV